MIYALKRWLYQRKLEQLEAKLAGREAALAALRFAGMTNYGIAEDIGVLKYKIAKLKEKHK
jgi:hypothetical protein